MQIQMSYPTAVLAVADGDKGVETFLMTGMREQEMMYLTWRDVDLNHCIVRVRHKPECGWTPRPTSNARSHSRQAGPVTQAVESEGRRRLPLVFPNSNCSPKGHSLRMCKTVERRAELPKDDFWLHKFRATFATRALRSGVDLRTVQMWMGHTDLESTMRYLKANRGKAVREPDLVMKHSELQQIVRSASRVPVQDRARHTIKTVVQALDRLLQE